MTLGSTNLFEGGFTTTTFSNHLLLLPLALPEASHPEDGEGRVPVSI